MYTCPADLFGLTGYAAALAQLLPWLLGAAGEPPIRCPFPQTVACQDIILLIKPMPFNYNHPAPISDAEWGELAALPVVRENWHLDEADGGRELALLAYGAKFDYEHESFRFADLFVLTAWLGMGPRGDADNAVVIVGRDPENGGALTPLVLPFPDSTR